MKQLLAAVVAVLGFSYAFADEPNTWWVAKEDKNASDELVTGRGTEALPFRTIQAALDNPDFVAGDNVFVKRGRYDEGCTCPSGSYQQTNRVYITKKVYLKAVEGRGKTSIVGKWGSKSASTGKGADGIRCIYVKGASGTVIEGFTIEQGGAFANDGGGYYVTSKRTFNYGGGLYVDDDKKDVYVVDCAFYNCTGRWGSAFRGGTAIRCVIDHCQSPHSNSSAVMHNAYAFACAATRCYYGGSEVRYAVEAGSVAVNCSFIGNACGSTTNGPAYNCIFAGQTKGTKLPGEIAQDSYGSTVATDVVFAPGFDDFRLQDDSPALVVAGNPAHKQVLLDLGVPEEFLKKDLAGNDIDWSAPLLVGAVQDVATRATALVVFDDTTVVNGRVVRPNRWICAETFPTAYELQPFDGTRSFFGFKHDPVYKSSIGKYVRPGYDFLLYAGFARVIPPARSTFDLVTYSPKYAAADLWVDPTAAGSDEDGDGSAQKPFKTLQKAVDSVEVPLTVIHAKPGDYSEGGRKYSGLMSRVSFQGIDSNSVLMKAEEGPSVTTIWGAADPETAEDGTLPGCGTNAVRCVCARAGYTHIQGFTLRNGHTFATTNGTVATTDTVLSGAAVGQTGDDMWSTPASVLDCVATNCVSSGSLFRSVYSHRCRVLGNLAHGRVFEGGYQMSNLIVGNRAAGLFEQQPDGTSWVLMNTCVGNTLAPGIDAFDNWRGGANVYATIIVGGAVRTKAGADVGNVVWEQETTSKLDKNNSVVADPVFANAAEGDYRPAIGGPSVDNMPADSFRTFCLYGASDVDGHSLRTTEDGKLTAGCIQANLPTAVVVTVPDDSLSINGVPGGSAVKIFEPDQTGGVEVTVSATTGKDRWTKGFVLGGVEHLFAGYPGSETLTMNPPVVAVLEPIASLEWYVDATHGNDVNNGFTAALAKKTFAEVFTNCAVTAGDTVYALPGTYAEGEMHVTATSPIACRAVVPADVSLVAVGAAEETVIKGAESPDPVNEYGMGTNAVRCVALGSRAVVRGFTLTGGRTMTGGVSGNAGTEVGAGAAVWGVGRNTSSVAEFCIISNNVAGAGGGGCYATYRGCRLYGNYAADNENGTALYRTGNLYDCVVDENPGNYPVMYPGDVFRCTFGLNGGDRSVYYYQPGDSRFRIFNSVIGRPGNNAQVYWNCVVYTNSKWTVSAARLAAGNSIGVSSFADLELDENLRPLKDSPTVDAGDDDQRGANFPETDPDGVPRVLNNGRFDIGAFEYDWRIDYAKDLGKRIVVTDVSSNVVETADGKVEIPEGFLKLDWRSKGKPLVFKAQVSGEGALAVNVNGEPFVTLTESDKPEVRIPETLDLTKLEFVFTGSGSATLAGFRRESGALLILR